MRCCTLLLAATALAQAGLVRVELMERSDVLDGATKPPYERIIARAHFAVDPENPVNKVITDIALAPRNEKGLVEFSADIYVLKPRDSAQGNGTALLEISNRGGKGLLSTFSYATSNRDPRTDADFGDRFLLDVGYTLVWVGWQWDVPKDDRLVRLHAPVATEGGKPITGPVRAQMIPEQHEKSMPLADRNHIPYLPLDPSEAKAQLTVRDNRDAAPRTIPRKAWRFVGDHVEYGPGFEPGKIYEVVYTAQNPVVMGLGFAAVRDLMSFLRYGGNGVTLLGDQSRYLKRGIAFGTSQSGRFLRHFLFLGMNQDEKNRPVFDGVWANVAGAGRGSFNHRFGQASRDGHPTLNLNFPTDLFPFADMPERDKDYGASDGLIARPELSPFVPRVFYTNGSYEYWGRAASLIHTTPDGAYDVPLAPATRIYAIAGVQHGSASFPPASNPQVQNTPGSLDFRPVMRALLTRMDAWCRNAAEPPPSRYPSVADKQLLTLDEFRFPGREKPARIYTPFHLDFGPRFREEGIVTREPPQVGKAFGTRVPAVDADGNEIAGIRLPAVNVPLAAYSGWNLRAPALGLPTDLYPMVGATIAFPREKIAARYASREDYLAKVKAAMDDLIAAGFLLELDRPRLMKDAAARWDYFTGQN